jgi:hypothetical protein
MSENFFSFIIIKQGRGHKMFYNNLAIWFSIKINLTVALFIWGSFPFNLDQIYIPGILVWRLLNIKKYHERVLFAS